MNFILSTFFTAALNHAVVALPNDLPMHESYVTDEAVCYTQLNENLIAKPVCVVPVRDWRAIQPITRARARNCPLNENLVHECK